MIGLMLVGLLIFVLCLLWMFVVAPVTMLAKLFIWITKAGKDHDDLSG